MLLQCAMIHRQAVHRFHVQARNPAARLLSSAATRQLLTRDFIAKSLYSQDVGYFATRDVINDLPGPLEFTSMMGELHYRLDVKKAYESKLSAWMTPVEVFSPYFSEALARFIAKEAKKSSSSGEHPRKLPSNGRNKRAAGRKNVGGGDGVEHLVVYEAGGGTGTNALNVLDWLRREEPKLYERTEYTIVEISPRLAKLQAERVCAVHENCRVANANVLEWGMSGEVDPRPCFFLGMELLDNLPHDKIAWVVPDVADGNGSKISPAAMEGQDGDRKLLCEAVVVENPDGGFREVFRPVRDPLIRELLTICPDLVAMVKNRREQPPFAVAGSERDSGSSPMAFIGKVLAGLLGSGGGGGGFGALRPEHCAAFVPTGSLRLLQALQARLPRHRAVLADFDSFDGSSETRVVGGGPAAAAATRGGTGTGAVGAGQSPVVENDESLTAFQAPIVSSRDPATGSVTDHATYMVPLGTADIFFPTCFRRLAQLHATVCNSSGECGGGIRPGGSGGGGKVVRRAKGLVVKQAEFLREFADLKATRTFSGFNPLVDDFRNSSVFLSGAVRGDAV